MHGAFRLCDNLLYTDNMLKFYLFIFILGAFLQKAYPEVTIIFADNMKVCFAEGTEERPAVGRPYIDQFCGRFKNLDNVREVIGRCSTTNNLTLSENNTFATHVTEFCEHPEGTDPPRTPHKECLIIQMEDSFDNLPISFQNGALYVGSARIHCKSKNIVFGCFKVGKTFESAEVNLTARMTDFTEFYYEHNCITEAQVGGATVQVGGATVSSVLSWNLLLGVLLVSSMFLA